MSGEPALTNPFKVLTPEDMEASDVNQLFVDPFTDFSKIRDPGHTMINGPRGCGKSMILRYLLPDCQCLARGCSLRELPSLAFLVSSKNAGPNVTEFGRLKDQHADIVLNEHVLTIFVGTKVLSSLARLDTGEDEGDLALATELFETDFVRRANLAGANVTALPDNTTAARDVFRHMATLCEQFYVEVLQYARRLAYNGSKPVPYEGPLLGYVDFLLPLMSRFRELPFLPSGPIYLMIDDADYLSRSQTVILNSWVSARTQLDVSIKISTQLRYKTYATVSGIPIQAPHDFQSINVSDVYTTRQGRYLSRVEQIVEKRLRKAGIDVSPAEFFPPDHEQEQAIKSLGATIRQRWVEEGRGYRADDDVTRYARPEYIRSLGGRAKSSSTYSYSGFEQLVHISSGLVRYFLEPAAVMFDEQRSRTKGGDVASISASIQNQVIREAANRLMFSEFDEIKKEEMLGGLGAAGEPQSDGAPGVMDRLQNLISALGGTFRLKLVSDDSERRVFSVAISGKPDREVVDTFELGVRYGYFHRSSIGNKDGTGRTRLYVLTRRLAPFFTLDPSSFAGYLWLSSDVLASVMSNPDTVLRKMKKDGVASVADTDQLTLFE